MTYLREEGDLTEKVWERYPLVRRPAALFDPGIHGRGHQRLGDEEMDGHVSVERKLETVHRVVGLLRETIDLPNKLRSHNLQRPVDDYLGGVPVEMRDSAPLGADTFTEPFDAAHQFSLADTTPTQSEQNRSHQCGRHHHGSVIDVGEDAITQGS